MHYFWGSTHSIRPQPKIIPSPDVLVGENRWTVLSRQEHWRQTRTCGTLDRSSVCILPSRFDILPQRQPNCVISLLHRSVRSWFVLACASRVVLAADDKRGDLSNCHRGRTKKFSCFESRHGGCLEQHIAESQWNSAFHRKEKPEDRYFLFFFFC